jgi:tRNA uridine 5-carboxymethylaminomethyl modification enzyme
MEEKVEKSTELEEFLRETSLKPGIINPILEENESSPVDQAYRAAQILQDQI